MNWKFWKKDESTDDETVIQVKNMTSLNPQTVATEIYVSAKSRTKAYNLYKKLKAEEQK